MSPAPTLLASAAQLDLSGRFVYSTTVAASPAGASETTVATVTLPDLGGITVTQGVWLFGWVAYTVGTSGVSATLRVRRTNTSGTVVVSTGALTKTAAQLYADDVNSVDTGGTGQQVYVLTLTVGSGAAASTVSAVFLGAVLI